MVDRWSRVENYRESFLVAQAIDDVTSERQKGQKEETSSMKEFRGRVLGHVIEKDLTEAV